MIADKNLGNQERSIYKPFGEENEQVLGASQAVETIGWIGERQGCKTHVVFFPILFLRLDLFRKGSIPWFAAMQFFLRRAVRVTGFTR